MSHLVRHADMADGNAKAQHLLQLELDGGLDLLDLQSPFRAELGI